MDIIATAREMGKALQETAEYKAYVAAREANDNDEKLQEMIQEFNLTKMQISAASQQENRDTDKIADLSQKLQNLYNEIMENPHMDAYNDSKTALDNILKQVNFVLEMAANGEDPMTCPTESSSCSGSCSTCGGCH
jgi:cell fate (sporulation/competence/biofilm development) regulator YlbF (YheA/YmcA/DUF963 family)